MMRAIAAAEKELATNQKQVSTHSRAAFALLLPGFATTVTCSSRRARGRPPFAKQLELMRSVVALFILRSDTHVHVKSHTYKYIVYTIIMTSIRMHNTTLALI
ncbi:unnamed protein product [Cuscuta campestris]|uniref:Uncharacterized protein n=1 Tax=Cuscuta campestris TaxID=132261 RepID=A0A484KYK0_9ASTE|nr:unnamed protein product [Cuscuta campestris]